MNKTIKEWYETLPEPYKSQALKNCFKNRLTNTRSSLAGAIMEGLSWSSTPEGGEYWKSLYHKAEKGTIEAPKSEQAFDNIVIRKPKKVIL